MSFIASCFLCIVLRSLFLPVVHHHVILCRRVNLFRLLLQTCLPLLLRHLHFHIIIASCFLLVCRSSPPVSRVSFIASRFMYIVHRLLFLVYHSSPPASCLCITHRFLFLPFVHHHVLLCRRSNRFPLLLQTCLPLLLRHLLFQRLLQLLLLLLS